MKLKKLIKINWIIGTVIAICLTSTGIMAMPPHPHSHEAGKLIGHFEEDGQLTTQQELAKGINVPSPMGNLASPSVTGNYNILTILVSFSDQVDSVTPGFFDTLIYGSTIGTVKHYYDNVSYGQLDIIGVVLPSDLGWVDAPQTYAYYVDGQKGFGAYPQNAQRLVEDAANAVDPYVDFSDYDNNGDGYVDGLIIVHTGSGYEFSSDVNDIHSHKWATNGPKYHDGVYVYEYAMQPEYWSSPGDMTCGVFCHELGHVFGLPDLYDTDYTSRGVGIWSLMAAGSWGGPGYDGSRPSEPDAWSRIELGFKTATNVTSNMNNASIASIESGGPIYKIWTSGVSGDEYYLVENRQQTGYGQYLPGSGLLIWHIDDALTGGYNVNNNEWYPGHTSSGHYGVALEQADGLFQLENYTNSGNSGDPFPGSTSNTSFSSLSTPNTNAYNGDDTYVSVSNISNSASIMTANFQISLLSDIDDEGDEASVLPSQFGLNQNYPNPFNPATTISFNLPSASNVVVKIYDILGGTITTLADNLYPAGQINVVWDGKTSNGEQAPSGIYLYSVETDFGTEASKMTLLK